MHGGSGELLQSFVCDHTVAFTHWSSVGQHAEDTMGVSGAVGGSILSHVDHPDLGRPHVIGDGGDGLVQSFVHVAGPSWMGLEIIRHVCHWHIICIQLHKEAS